MSTILERERQLLRAMKEQDFQPYFNGDRGDAFNTIAGVFDSLLEYQNAVIRMTAMQPIIRARYEGQELREKMADLDSIRHSSHEAAIANIAMLNRICDAYGAEKIADIDTTDRYQVADFVGEYCAEIYGAGKSRTPEN